MKRSKREEVIAGMGIMHTWAEYQIENAKLIFDDKACEKVIEWTDEAIDLLKEPEQLVHCSECIHFRADNVPYKGCGFCELLSRTYEGQHYCADGVAKA